LLFTIDEIAYATNGRVLGNAGGSVSGVSTDSRTVTKGEMFVPLRGGRFDGHNFISQAAGKGVRVFLAQNDRLTEGRVPAGATVITVQDTLCALGDLATFHRRRFDIPVIGVTGSNGKTTVKEMLASILSLTGQGLKTSGNLNNLIGLPRMLFELKRGDLWAVLEMGMSEPGEIDRLAEIAGPSVGVITNAFPAHLESMGSVEAVAKAKGELFMRLPEGGCAVYNEDDLLIGKLPVPAGVRRFSFGLHGAEIGACEIERAGRHGQRFTLLLPEKKLHVTLKALGLHNVCNSLAAAAAATALEIEPELIGKGLDQFIPYDKRFKLEELDGIVLIDDSYNANPASMRAALETLREIREECRSIAVLGDMLELGVIAQEAHLELGRHAALCVERLYLLGAMANTVAYGAREGGLPEGNVIVAENHEDILADLLMTLAHGDFILVKGSRGMEMDKIAEGIRREFPHSKEIGATV